MKSLSVTAIKMKVVEQLFSAVLVFKNEQKGIWKHFPDFSMAERFTFEGASLGQIISS